MLKYFALLGLSVLIVHGNVDTCRFVPDGVFINDPSSCGGWIQCFNQTGTYGKCLNGLPFDPETGFCDRNFICNEPADSPTPDDHCQGKLDGAFVNNPASCASFFRCEKDKSNAGECQNGRVFNPDTQTCDGPSNYKCEDAPPAEVKLESLACVGVPNHQVVNDERNCSAYFICEFGVGRSGSCPDDLQYDALSGECGYAEEVKCVNPTPAPANPCDSKTEEWSYVNDNASCAGYILCNFETISEYGKCADPYWYNPNTNECDYRENVNCIQSVCEDVVGHKFVAAPDSCDGYYSCQDGMELNKLVCEESFYFDEVHQVCDDPQYVKCTKETHPSSGSESEKDPGAEPEVKPDPEENTDPGEPEANTNPKQSGKEAESETQSDNTNNKKPETETVDKPETKSDTDPIQPDTGADNSESENDTDTKEPKDETEDEAQSVDPGTEPEVKPDPEKNTDPVEPGANTDPKPSGEEAESETQSDNTNNKKPETETVDKPETKSDTDPIQPGTGADNSESENDTDTKEPKDETDDEAQSGDDDTDDKEPETKEDTNPAKPGIDTDNIENDTDTKQAEEESEGAEESKDASQKNDPKSSEDGADGQ